MVDTTLYGEYVWPIPVNIELNKSGTSKKRVAYNHWIIDILILGMLHNVFSEYFKDRISDYIS